MKDYKYKISFASKIRCLISEEKDKFLAEASLKSLRGIIPEDLKEQEDILCVAFNAFTPNLVNKNGAVVDTETALKLHKSFIHKPINLDHTRTNGSIGHIVSSGFSKFDINYANGAGSELLEAKAVKELKSPFNVSLSAVLYRLYAGKLIDYLEEANDPNSEHFMSISASWELMYSDYYLAVGSKYLDECEIIKDEAEIEKLSKYLLNNGGKGVTPEGKPISMLIVGDVIAAGIGLTENPAGELKGIVTATEKPKIQIKASYSCPECGEESEMDDDMDDETEHSCAKCGKKSMGKKWKSKANDNLINQGILDLINKMEDEDYRKELILAAEKVKNLKISQISNPQLKNPDVKESKSNLNIKNNTNKIMLKTLKDLNDEILKEATASEIIKASKIDLDAEIDKISADWKEKKDKVDKELQAAQEGQEKLQKEVEATKTELSKVQEELNKLIKAAQDKEAEETFNARMNYFDSEFELDEKSRNAVANRIKTLDNDAYKQEKEDLEVLLAAKKKGKKEEKVEKKEEVKETKASVEDKTDEQVIDDAIDKGEKKTAAVAATTTVTETQAQKFAKAFGKDAWVIKTNKR